MRSEWGIGDGGFNDEHGRPVDLGLGFTTWFESLPHCIKALRAENPNSEEAMVLELKYNIRHRRWSNAHTIAKKWLEEVNSECAYCYYTLTMDNKDDRVGLSWAKRVSFPLTDSLNALIYLIIACGLVQGLRTKTTGYIQLGLLFNAVDYAGRLGIDMLGPFYPDSPQNRMSPNSRSLPTTL